jgi:hypothetical protein
MLEIILSVVAAVSNSLLKFVKIGGKVAKRLYPSEFSRRE